MRKKQGLVRTLLVGGVVAATASTALVAGLASPAAAEPMTSYVAVGSDTTQDVMNGLSRGIGGGFIGSWDAVNPVTGATHDLINTKPGCKFARPNGSGEGVDALRVSLGAATNGKAPAPLPVVGCNTSPATQPIDIARSSSGPVNNTTGALVYIPYALDAVAPATGATTTITTADQFTIATLTTLYKNCSPVTVGGVTYTPDVNIHLYIPQSGSGTRKFWAKTLGNYNPDSPPSCNHDHMFNSATNDFSGAQVEEHDGTVLEQDSLGLAPFSIAQWLSDSRATQTFVNDRRHGAVLHSLVDAANVTQAPTTTPGGGNLNASYPITREVFNVLQYSKVVGASTDPNLVSMFVGTGSAICARGTIIRRYGFATLDGVSSPHTCGATSDDLREAL